MLFHGSSQVPLNHAFDVRGIPVSNTGNAQDAATIAAEVLAAAMAQASKKFWCMWEPKITKLWGGYSTDAELIFQSGKWMFWQIYKIVSWITKPQSNSSKSKPWTMHIMRSSSSETCVAVKFFTRICLGISAWPSREATMRPIF